MWSDKYNYYNIQSDNEYSKKVETERVLNIFLKTGLFIKENHQTLSNSENFPWVDIILVETKDGNFASSEKKIPFVNLIAIVCSKGQNIDQDIYLKTFSQVARELNWRVYLEEDDSENQNIEIEYPK
jgi:hypothetical protein